MAGKLSVAVTGGTGFVGRAVLDALLLRGVEVSAVNCATAGGSVISRAEFAFWRETSRTREANYAKFWPGTMLLCIWRGTDCRTTDRFTTSKLNSRGSIGF